MPPFFNCFLMSRARGPRQIIAVTFSSVVNPFKVVTPFRSVMLSPDNFTPLKTRRWNMALFTLWPSWIGSAVMFWPGNYPLLWIRHSVCRPWKMPCAFLHRKSLTWTRGRSLRQRTLSVPLKRIISRSVWMAVGGSMITSL